jgi:hypothetical protein
MSEYIHPKKFKFPNRDRHIVDSKMVAELLGDFVGHNGDRNNDKCRIAEV